MRVTSSPSALLRASLQIAPVCLLASATAAHAQSVQDFQLPPSATPTPTPNVQGPVDPDAPQTRPRPVNTPTPTPSPTLSPRPGPVVTATPTPSPTVQRTPTPGPTARPTQTPASRPSASTPTQPVSTPTPTQAEQASANAREQDRRETPAPAIPANTPAPDTAQATSGEETNPAFPLYWIGAALALLALLGGALFWRRRQAAAAPPAIEPPMPNRDRADAGAAAMAAMPTEPFSVRFEALKLTRSMMFATLKYRMTIINRTDRALRDVTAAIDMTSAHSNLPMEQQVAGADTHLEPSHTTARLAANQSVRFEGEVQLPLAQANFIRQGNAALLVPLVRMRVLAENASALVKTFVTGQASAAGSARLQPFRLDDGPRSFQPLSQRALD